jgi:hypothetical protein
LAATQTGSAHSGCSKILVLQSSAKSWTSRCFPRDLFAKEVSGLLCGKRNPALLNLWQAMPQVQPG